MKLPFICLTTLLTLILLPVAREAPKPLSLFDGKSFEGWEGDTEKMFRIEDGAIVGGSLKEKISQQRLPHLKEIVQGFRASA